MEIVYFRWWSSAILYRFLPHSKRRIYAHAHFFEMELTPTFSLFVLTLVPFPYFDRLLGAVVVLYGCWCVMDCKPNF